MAEDSDSDVVFENSPLHLHLKDCGMEDLTYEMKSVAKDGILVSSPYELSQSPWTVQNLNNFCFHKLFAYVINIFWNHNVKMKMTSLYKKSLVGLIVNSKVLIEDDLLFIDNAMELDTGKSDFEYKILNTKSRIVMTLIIPCLVAYLFNRVIYPELFWKFKFITDIISLSLFIYGIYFSVQSLILKFRKSYMEELKNILSDILVVNNKLIKCSEKSLRLIQEAELVVRGFTLISHQSPVWRLEQNNLQKTQRQCPQLRQCLFHIMREAMLILKSETSFLLTNFSVHTEIDSMVNYLACIPLKEYGACLQISGHDSESIQELFKVTDGYSIASLKGMRHLYILQQSEFFRRLALTYESCNEFIEKIDMNYLTKLKIRIYIQLEDLQRSLECHSSILLNKEPKNIKMRNEHKTSSVNDLYTAIHSLDLHLQSALLRVRTLGDILQQNIEQEENSSMSPSDENFKELIKQVRQELYACKGCWEEGLNRLEKMEKKESEIIAKKIIPPSTKDCNEVRKEVKLIGMSEPVIEDEVFEAYINEQEEFEQSDYGWDEFISPEEKARKKKEKEEALRVLSELKNVISHRAIERERREALALQRVSMKSECNSNSDLKKVSDSCLINDQGKLSVEQMQFNGKIAEKGDNLSSENEKITVTTQNYTLEESDENLSNDDYSDDPDLNERTEKNKTKNNDFIYQSQDHSEPQSGKTLNNLPTNALSFTANLAALVAARSQLLGLEEQTFGDDDDDDDDSDDVDDDNDDDDKHAIERLKFEYNDNDNK